MPCLGSFAGSVGIATCEGTYGSAHVVPACGITQLVGDVVALVGIDLDVMYGQIHGLVEPNAQGHLLARHLVASLTPRWPAPPSAYWTSPETARWVATGDGPLE